MDLANAHALVTGGASGMGRAFVEALLDEGAAVAFCDVDADAVAATEAALAGRGTVKGFVADVADEARVDALIPEVARALGGLDVLINNAGIFRDALLVRPDPRNGGLVRMTLAQWQQVIDVDLTGPFLCTRAFAGHCIEHGTKAGVVVNISSVARHGNRGQSNYSAAKAGLVADTKLWAEELARYGIRVGAVAPGFVRTPILDGMRDDVLAKLVSTVPLKRVAEPSEIWQAVRFVIACDYFTGRCVDVDGGLRL